MISKLNVLNFLSIFLSVIFQILLIRNFGATLQTDAYYLTIGITQFVNALFLGFTTDLFIPVYNEVKVKGEAESLKFTGAVFLFIIIIGSILSAIAYVMAPAIVKLFATGFTADKVHFTSSLIKILSVTIVLSALNGLLIAALNANLFMTVTYAAALTTPALNNLALIFFSKTHGVTALAYSIVLGSALNFFLLFLCHIAKIGWRFSKPWVNKDISYLLRKNCVLRIGHSINALKGPLTTNVLSYFPIGYITLFSYTDKILNILFRVTNSPMLNILFVRASSYIATNKSSEIRSVAKSSLKSNFVLFVFVLIPAVIIFKKVFGFAVINRFSSVEIDIMYSLLLCLIPYYLILSLELPFTYITIAMKQGSKIVQINLVSLLLYALCLMASIKWLMIYTIPIAMSCAQIYNNFAYSKFVNDRLSIFDKELVKAFVQYTFLGILLVSINFCWGNNFILQIYANILTLCLWLAFVGKDVIMVFKLVTKRGEIK